MDYSGDEFTCSEPWDWQADDYCLPKDFNSDISQCLWDGVAQGHEDLSYMFNERTPVKACGDLAYQASAGELYKEPEEYRLTSSQAKRRRKLQFDSQVIDLPLLSGEISSEFLKSKETKDTLEEGLPETSQVVSGLSDSFAPSGYEVLDQSSEVWITGCFNNADEGEDLNSGDKNVSGVSDVQLNITEECNILPVYEASVVKDLPLQPPQNSCFKGKQSYRQTSTKVASSIVYPFNFIKPCKFHGDVTLKDINQWICPPPPAKVKKSNEDPSASYPTSAFSGKPVVGKTKIRTEGGKGSITIMRTKG